MSLYDLALAPFVDYGFMRRALVGCLALSFGACPLGVMLVLRRMSLVGDAMSHAILPGAAVGFLLAGFSLFAMTIGGMITGTVLAVFFVPIFFVVVRGLFKGSKRQQAMYAQHAKEAGVGEDPHSPDPKDAHDHA